MSSQQLQLHALSFQREDNNNTTTTFRRCREEVLPPLGSALHRVSAVAIYTTTGSARAISAFSGRCTADDSARDDQAENVHHIYICDTIVVPNMHALKIAFRLGTLTEDWRERRVRFQRAREYDSLSKPVVVCGGWRHSTTKWQWRCRRAKARRTSSAKRDSFRRQMYTAVHSVSGVSL